VTFSDGEMESLESHGEFVVGGRVQASANQIPTGRINGKRGKILKMVVNGGLRVRVAWDDGVTTWESARWMRPLDVVTALGEVADGD
jgi:hypothetical protein